MAKITEQKLSEMIKESIEHAFLCESFNDKRISQEIAEHGGVSKIDRRYSAQFYADYDLQNAEYCGYLDQDAMTQIYNCDLRWEIHKRIIPTGDGGAVVVKQGDDPMVAPGSYQTKWAKKVSGRNQKWGEAGPNKDEFSFENALKNGRFSRREQYVVPNRDNTEERRAERFRK